MDQYGSHVRNSTEDGPYMCVCMCVWGGGGAHSACMHASMCVDAFEIEREREWTSKAAILYCAGRVWHFNFFQRSITVLLHSRLLLYTVDVEAR